MKNRVTSESGSAVSLFPFLAVLLCTMGALLVLLVVLAQRAGERAVAEADLPPVAQASLQQELPADTEEAANLAKQLEEVQAYQKQLADLRKQADARLKAEQQRLSYLEEHTRRLEHELARLSIAAETLKATEQNQSVDQQQAEQELARLQQLIKDTEAQLKDLRDQGQGRRSYAIVPYKGPNGTYRKPVYIECRSDAIILHPEGIRLRESDFLASSWPGNPLAAALRATREHVNAQAALAGAPEPLDPYPMILVRPDGIKQYRLARAAITSWDSNYGYEFIDSDWDLNFPEAPDPQLARIQQHAIMLSRERLARLIRSAPRRFGFRAGGQASASASGATGSSGFGGGNAGGEFGYGSQQSELQSGGSGDGNGLSSSNRAGSESANRQGGEFQYGAMSGDAAGGQLGKESSGSFESDISKEGTAGVANSNGMGGSAGQSGTAGGSEDSSQLGANGGTSTASAGKNAGGASANGNAKGSSSSGAGASGQPSSIADSRGRNWAVQDGNRGSVPIRRPIQVIVREDQIALLPSRHATDGDAAVGKLISLKQPMNQVSEEFVTALRTRIKGWGLAGSGLYWRPVLKLNVGPGAERTAGQVFQLLKDSGVEVSVPETARARQGGVTDAVR